MRDQETALVRVYAFVGPPTNLEDTILKRQENDHIVREPYFRMFSLNTQSLVVDETQDPPSLPLFDNHFCQEDAEVNETQLEYLQDSLDEHLLQVCTQVPEREFTASARHHNRQQYQPRQQAVLPSNTIALGSLNLYSNQPIAQILALVLRILDPTQITLSKGPNKGQSIALQSVIICDQSCSYCILSVWRNEIQLLNGLKNGDIILVTNVKAKLFRQQPSVTATAQSKLHCLRHWDADAKPPHFVDTGAFIVPNLYGSVLALENWACSEQHLLSKSITQDEDVFPSNKRAKVSKIDRSFASIQELHNAAFTGEARLNVVIQQLFFEGSSVSHTELNAGNIMEIMCVMCRSCNQVLQPDHSGIFSCVSCASTASITIAFKPLTLCFKDAMQNCMEIQIESIAAERLLMTDLKMFTLSGSHEKHIAQAWRSLCNQKAVISLFCRTERDTNGFITWRAQPTFVSLELLG